MGWPIDFGHARPLQRRITKTASFGPFASSKYQIISEADKQDVTKPDVVAGLAQFDAAAIVLVVNAAHRTDETYDIYVTGGLMKVVQITDDSGIQIAEAHPLRWDVVHFPQIASAVTKGTPKIYVARVNGIILPETVTVASPGVTAIDPACLDISAPASAQGIKTLTAGMVRHGYWGDHLTHELVAAGTAPSIDYEIWLSAAAI